MDFGNIIGYIIGLAIGLLFLIYLWKVGVEFNYKYMQKHQKVEQIQNIDLSKLAEQMKEIHRFSEQLIIEKDEFITEMDEIVLYFREQQFQMRKNK